MTDTPLHAADPATPARADFDDENRLRPQFVREVLDLAEAGDVEGARERVGRLHPADIADLFELAPSDGRALLAATLGELVSAEVI